MLHITNGTATQIPIAGEVVYWADALFEGPVPGGLSLRDTSRVREQYLSEFGGASFEARDRSLERAGEHDEVALWFEHDLYDQLQLIQILNFIRPAGARLTMICVDRYLGPMPAADLKALFPQRREVTAEQLRLAREAWSAFTSAEPRNVERLVHGSTAALPFLQGALLRHLQQFPSKLNGLSRTEQQILEIVSSGVGRPKAIFGADQDREERIFMGDCFFYRYVDRLCDAAVPLLERKDGEVALTREGHRVLNCRADAVDLNGLDRWYGGAHFEVDGPDWRWDVSTNRLYLRNNS